MAWLPFQKEKKEEKNRLDLRAYGNRLNQVPRDTNKKLGPSLELGDEYFYTGPKIFDLYFIFIDEQKKKLNIKRSSLKLFFKRFDV